MQMMFVLIVILSSQFQFSASDINFYSGFGHFVTGPHASAGI